MICPYCGGSGLLNNNEGLTDNSLNETYLTVDDVCPICKGAGLLDKELFLIIEGRKNENLQHWR